METTIKNTENLTNNFNKASKSVMMLLFVFLLTFFNILNTSAQCAMCRAVLETEEGGLKAESVNDGIVYLMAFPYILVGIIGYIVYKSRQPKVSKTK